jgi:hypothetical protein
MTALLRGEIAAFGGYRQGRTFAAMRAEARETSAPGAGQRSMYDRIHRPDT